MKKKGPALRSASVEGFTLIELLVVIAIIALLMAILLPALARAKEQGKRAFCLKSMGQIMVAWHMYCDDNRDKIPGTYTTRCVCLSPGTIYPFDTDCKRNPIYSKHGSYPSWVEMVHQWDRRYEASAGSKNGEHYYDRWPDGTASVPSANFSLDKAARQSDEDWRHAIACGTLWKYLKDTRVYACPTGDKGHRVTYAGSSAANGIHNTPSWCNANYTKYQSTQPDAWKTPSHRYRSDFKQPAHRMIFICLGNMGGCGYHFRNLSDYLDKGCWYGAPPLRHGNGTNLAFADGHCEYIKWGKQAVSVAKNGWTLSQGSTCPPPGGQPSPCDPDLIYMARVTCGHLGDFVDVPHKPLAGCNWEKW